VAHCAICNGQLSWAYGYGSLYCTHMCEWLGRNLTPEQKAEMLKYMAEARARNEAAEAARVKQRQEESDKVNYERLKKKFET
jgi:hypothetical protein